MVKYTVTVSTAKFAGAATLNNVFIKLVGTDGESDRTWLMGFKGAASFMIGAVSISSYQITAYLQTQRYPKQQKITLMTLYKIIFMQFFMLLHSMILF